MEDFDTWMGTHQALWRKERIPSVESGPLNVKQWPWILSPALWEEGLWPGIRSGSADALPDYLRAQRVQKHLRCHNLKSSWVACANLYFPFRSSAEGRSLLAGFLRAHVATEVESVERIELEYTEEGDLHPSSLLGESGGSRGKGQTSPDVAFIVNGGRGLVLTESKLAEHSFYPCSARTREDKPGRPGNPDPDRCTHPLAVLDDPPAQCHQVVWKRKYWSVLKPLIDRAALSGLTACPAAFAGYQLFRQQAFAEGIARSGKYDLVVSAVAMDERNEELANCLKDTGLTNLSEWGALFRGLAKFVVFTHQQWVGWVRREQTGEWTTWLEWIESRYGYF